MVYVTSDYHIGHQNILKFCDRPFRDLDHMHNVLVNNYNATVGEDDVCYFLGDMGLKRDVVKPVMDRLHGTKVLILGNHDKNPTYMYNSGFDVVLHGATLYHQNLKITLGHCPLLGYHREDLSEYPEQGTWWYGDNRKKFIPFICTVDDQDIHAHGHIHSPGDGKSEKICGKQFDVGVDANGMRPLSLDEMIKQWRAFHKKC